MKFVASTALVALLVLGTVGACDGTKSDAPEPNADNIVNGDRTQVIRFPDGFRNVAFSCYKGNGVYVTSRGSAATAIVSSSITVIPRDPACG